MSMRFEIMSDLRSMSDTMRYSDYDLDEIRAREIDMHAMAIAGHLQEGIATAMQGAVVDHVKVIIRDYVTDELAEAVAKNDLSLESLKREIEGVNGKLRWLILLVLGLTPMSLLF